MTSTEADLLIEDIRQLKLPFDPFAPVKVEECKMKCLQATEQGQELLENHHQVQFVDTVSKCGLGCAGQWLLPKTDKARRTYPPSQSKTEISSTKQKIIMFKITSEPSYTVYYEKVGSYELKTSYEWTEYYGYVHVKTPMSSEQADQLIEDLREQFNQRPRQLPFDKFRPFKFEEKPVRYLSVTEQGQALLDGHHKAVFAVNVSHCASSGPVGWLFPVSRKTDRLYAMRQDWDREAEFIQFLGSLYSKEDGWILPSVLLKAVPE